MINLLSSFLGLDWYYYVLIFVIFCIVAIISYVIRFLIIKKPSAGTGDSATVDSKSISDGSGEDSDEDSDEDSGAVTPTIEAEEPAFVDSKYYRWQPDYQIVTKRTPEQQKIFDEYFVIKNYAYRKKPFLVLALIALLAGVAAIIVGLIVKPTIWMIGIGLIAVGVILLVSYFKVVTVRPGHIMTDNEYEKLVVEHISSMNVAQMGMKKLGLTADQVKAIKPVFIWDRVITGRSLKVFNPEDSSIHSSTHYVLMLFFTEEQLFVYKIQFDMCCNMQDEWTKEFFYRDICDFSSVEEYNILKIRSAKYEYNTQTYSIISTNSRIDFVINGNNPNIKSVHELKKKIREKKRL